MLHNLDKLQLAGIQETSILMIYCRDVALQRLNHINKMLRNLDKLQLAGIQETSIDDLLYKFSIATSKSSQ